MMETVGANKQIEIGDSASFSKTITEYDVYGFAGISGDFNPVHINKEYAKNSAFNGQIAHGMLVGSLISTVLGTKLPGEGTVYLEQDVKFLKPVYIGDTCTAVVEVTEIINREKGIYRLNTQIHNQSDLSVCDGYAIVKHLR